MSASPAAKGRHPLRNGKKIGTVQEKDFLKALMAEVNKL